tara:strand:- start:1345 stop:1677 length:333 start_codon:yes stop_codon:yes gene_type:complete
MTIKFAEHEDHTPELVDAIKALKPNSSFMLRDSHDFSTLVWNDSENSAPTESEVNTKLTELVNAHNAKNYRRQRAEEYPTLEDQLDDLYHNGIDGWKTTIKAVKDKYPKG